MKLGLPADYRNNHDVAMLLRLCDADEVLRVIRANDDWAGLVLRRMPKLKRAHHTVRQHSHSVDVA